MAERKNTSLGVALLILGIIGIAIIWIPSV